MHGPFSKILGARAHRPQDRRPWFNGILSMQVAAISSTYSKNSTIYMCQACNSGLAISNSTHTDSRRNQG